MGDKLAWWQRAVIYQVVTPSFQDSDGDGRGDLPGLISRLDYLRWLGVDAIWLTPFYPSPLESLGYDVSDYTGVHPCFGTLEDFERLVAEAHQRELRIVIDFVPNHTSAQHPWFVEACSGRDHPRRAWYLWQDPGPDGEPPNNWINTLGKSAWTLHEPSGQYYFSSFTPDLPDLNWRNPEVEQAVFAAMRWWLDRGVDGFRVDVIWMLLKDDQLRDNPANPAYRPGRPPDEALHSIYTRNLPDVHPIIAKMRRLVDEYGDRLLAGEVYARPEAFAQYYGSPEQPELHFPFNMSTTIGDWSVEQLAGTIESYEQALPAHAWPCWALGTHDSHRLATRATPAQTRLAALLLCTLRGTLSCYYGDELGIQDVDIPPEQRHDPRSHLLPDLDVGRDMARTPMQWDDSPNGGFSAGAPWLPPGDYQGVNVAAQRDDERSLLRLYRRLFELRRAEPALVAGAYVPVQRNEQLLVFRREHDTGSLLVALNFGARHQTFVGGDSLRGSLLLSTRLDRSGHAVTGTLALRPHEGLIIRLG